MCELTRLVSSALRTLSFLFGGWQVVCAVLAALTHLTIGTIIGLPGVILPQLTDSASHDIFLSTAEVALFGKSQSQSWSVSRPVRYFPWANVLIWKDTRCSHWAIWVGWDDYCDTSDKVLILKKDKTRYVLKPVAVVTNLMNSGSRRRCYYKD